MNSGYVWVEKYRPKTLDEMVLSPENRNYFSSLKGEVPNLLFVGTPGIGKTTIAKIIVQDILQCQYLYINASDENGIDTIRSKVSGFSQVKSIDGNIKIVILDEADGITIDGQRALRNTMEEYSAYTRFILTANYKHKIIPALQSRCQFFDIKPTLEDAVKRVYSILKREKIVIEEAQTRKFVELVKVNFPDLRKAINEIQKNCIEGVLSINTINTEHTTLDVIYEHIVQKNSIALRKYLITHENSFYGDYDTLMKDYLNYVYTLTISDLQKKEMIAIIADHLNKSAFVIDKEINCFACWINLERV